MGAQHWIISLILIYVLYRIWCLFFYNTPNDILLNKLYQWILSDESTSNERKTTRIFKDETL